MLQFGVVNIFPPHTTALETFQLAEELGFDTYWTTDSHVIWNEPYSLLGWLVAHSTSPRMRFGTMVTNPVSRDPIVLASAFATLNQITGGRMICGLGRGDSAVRVLRRNPANVAATARAAEVIKTLGSGKSMEIDGVQVEMPWASGDLTVCLAAYGPRMFRLAGRIADGVIIENADPYFIRWGLERMREGAKEAGRNPDDLAVIASAASVVTDDIDAARAEVRSFAALIVNHVAEVQRNAGTQAIPPEWAEFLEAHGEYDYLHHVDRDAPHAQHMPNDIVDRLAVIGTAAECERKLRELSDIGVTHFNLYAQVSDFPTVMRTYSREIIPALRGSAVTP